MQQEVSNGKAFGQWGEELAARYLEEKGFRILERNYRCSLGEIDLIVEKPSGTILFVEVKTRRSYDIVSLTELLSCNKRRHISRVAQYYLAVKKKGNRTADFALLAIDGAGEKPKFEWIEGAFDLEWGY